MRDTAERSHIAASGGLFRDDLPPGARLLSDGWTIT